VTPKVHYPLAFAGDGVGERSPEQTAIAMFAAARGYHRREDKPFWWAHFDRLNNPVDEWGDTSDVFLAELCARAVKATARQQAGLDHLLGYGLAPRGVAQEQLHHALATYKRWVGPAARRLAVQLVAVLWQRSQRRLLFGEQIANTPLQRTVRTSEGPSFVPARGNAREKLNPCAREI